MPEPRTRPPFAARLRTARERLGLSQQLLSERLGWGSDALWDLEADDDELPMAISVHDIGQLCLALQLNPAHLLAAVPAQAGAALPRLTPPQVVDLIQAHIRDAGIGPEAFGNEVGWDVERLLADPVQLWALNVDGLHDVCSGAGIDWMRALPPSSV